MQCSHKYRASKSKTELYRDFSVKIASKTDVQLSHATLGAVWSHQKNRNMYADIANEMIYYSGLDVIMGFGDPWMAQNINMLEGRRPGRISSI
ncbi:MAG: hypothetical protein U9N83_16390 [Thermodesulfobacteriota bacterium]|nr:hypothetical protein [Thermodesulfobacteriota bacterium]